MRKTEKMFAHQLKNPIHLNNMNKVGKKNEDPYLMDMKGNPVPVGARIVDGDEFEHGHAKVEL